MTDMTAIGWQALRDKFDADPDLKLRYQQAESSERPWQVRLAPHTTPGLNVKYLGDADDSSHFSP